MDIHGESEDLILWKQKLDEIVDLASNLPYENQKAAAECWSAALTKIQALWRNSDQCELAETEPESITTELNAVTQNCTENVIISPSIIKPPWLIPTEGVKVEYQEEEEDEEEEEEEEESEEEATMLHEDPKVTAMLHGDQTLTAVIKQELLMPHETDTKDILKSTEPNEVQSVHLIVSADPVLVPKMNKYKKVCKNEATGKMETAYQCEKCTKQCRTALALYKHRSSHLKRLECSICHQKLSNRHALNAHKRTHTGERPFPCTKCPSRFTTRGNLARHIASHDGEKPWQCAICGKRYTEKKSLKVHMRTHTGEKPYACSICPKRFSQSGILQTHILIHMDKFGHLCDVCGRSFRQRSQLVTHHLRHQGIRPFACPECHRKFTVKGDMERHHRTHTGERPFSCDVCGSSFARPQTLQEHKNRHFNFKPYVCKFCAKNFHELATASRHVKGLHGREIGSGPISDNIIRLTSNEQQQDSKQGILITHMNASDKNMNTDGRQSKLQAVAEECAVKIEEREEEREIKHHIFVMHTTDNEETELITIAEPPGSLEDVSGGSESAVSCGDCGGSESAVSCGDCGTLVSVTGLKDHDCNATQEVSVTEWLVQEETGSPGNTMEVSIESDPLSCVEQVEEGGDDEGLACVEEVDAADLNHAVTISEDGSITSMPLAQLAPLHLQLENDYMVVLSSNTRREEGSSRAFQT